MAPRNNYIFTLDMEVRDYELDSEEIVNNANYLHYLEHTRHRYCARRGLSFTEMRRRGIDPVLRNVEIEYLMPLRSGNRFRSCLSLERRGARFVFLQDIYLLPEMTPILRSKVTVVSLVDGKLSRGDELAEAFKMDLRR